MTLDEAIEQLVNLGESDPVTIATKIQERNEPDWLINELQALAGDVIAERARHQLGNARRSAQLALRPGDQISSAEMKIKKYWVPGSGWIVVGKLTADDMRKISHWYRKLAGALIQHARWCDTVLEMMEIENVKTVGRLKAPLPPLPEFEELAA